MKEMKVSYQEVMDELGNQIKKLSMEKAALICRINNMQDKMKEYGIDDTEELKKEDSGRPL